MLAVPAPVLAEVFEPDPVIIERGERTEQVEGKAWYLVTPDDAPLSPEQAIAAFRAGQFIDSYTPTIEENVESRDQWIALPIEAGKSNSDPIRRSVGLGALFFVSPHIYLLRGEGSLEPLLTESDQSDGELFSQKLTYLDSRSFQLAPGETAIVLINLDEADQPSIGLFREGELGRNQIIATMLRAIVNISNLAIGLCLMLVGILARRRITVLIAIGLTCITLLADTGLYASIFGRDFESRLAGWSASLSILLAVTAYTLIAGFRDKFLDPFPRFVKLMVVAAPLAMAFWLDWTKSDFAFGIAQMVLFSGFIALMALRLEISLRLRLTAALIILLALLNAILVDSGIFGSQVPDLTRLFLRDVSRIAAAGISLIVVIIDIRRSLAERDQMTAERISALEANAETSRKLLDIERKYSRARETAVLRKQQLAAASHDIRQPLVGLRASIREEADNLSPDLQERLSEAINYLEELTREYSDHGAGDGASKAHDDEAYSVELIVQTVEEMFAGEAAALGVTLQTLMVPCETRVPALALIRSVSNLVANALRHADATKVMLAVRHEEGGLIEVSDDGCGMDEAALNNVQLRGAKSATSDGDGLGLAIIHDLAKRHGFGFTLQSSPGGGTVAAIILPEA